MGTQEKNRKVKHTHSGVKSTSLLDLLYWLEEEWTKNSAKIKEELTHESVEGFDDWLLVLAKGWRSACDRKETSLAAIYPTSDLHPLLELFKTNYNPQELSHQLWVAWLWALGRSDDDRRTALGKESKLTGYSDVHLKLLLSEAEPMRVQFRPAYPKEWRITQAGGRRDHVPPPPREDPKGHRPGAPMRAPGLPPQGVVGRDREVEILVHMLALDPGGAGSVPAAVVRGMPGIGKTTLAIALAHHAAVHRALPDGVLWSSLGPKPDLRRGLEAWGRALGLDLVPEPDVPACSDRLRDKLYQTNMLLVVDDVWEPRHGACFQVGGPGCRLLLTTREMRVVCTLSTIDRTLDVEKLALDDAVALVRAIAPAVVRADMSSTRRLCAKLDGLPLALTLAGRLLAIEAYVPERVQRVLDNLIDRHEARLSLLQIEGRLGLSSDSPVTLQAILGLSVELLTETDQRRFAMLSVFGGEPLTWSLQIATRFWGCAQQEAEVTVSRFIQHGLVERRVGRYWTHALLADYAAWMCQRMGL